MNKHYHGQKQPISFKYETLDSLNAVKVFKFTGLTFLCTVYINEKSKLKTWQLTLFDII